MTAITIDDRTEWLEADGLGGFASGTTSGIRTRRYHALLLAATTPPTGRMVLVNGLDAWVEHLPEMAIVAGVSHPTALRARCRRAGAAPSWSRSLTSRGPPGPTGCRTAPESSMSCSSRRAVRSS